MVKLPDDKDKHPSFQAERPLECSECTKPIVTYYTEIVGRTIVRTCHCRDCPQLHRHLMMSPPETSTVTVEGGTGLCCGNCSTTLESVRMGHLLGCPVCYDVFADILISELLTSKKISPKLATTKKAAPLHVGRAPGETNELNPALRLIALNDALNDTLRREDYEQAAWLRDQIKALTENSHERKDEPKG